LHKKTKVVDHMLNRLTKITIYLLIFTTYANASSDYKELNNELLVDHWEANMIRWGKHWGEYINPDRGNKWDWRFASSYYDGQWVYQQISEYTNDHETWDKYARYSEIAYRDEYYRKNNYRIQGYYKFCHGLLNDYLDKGDTSIDDIQKLRDVPAFSRIDEYNGDYDGKSQHMSREVAYTLQTNICAEKAGLARQIDTIKILIPWIENHLHEWISGEYSADQGYFQPFMFALSAHALIEFYEWEMQNERDPHKYWPNRNWSSILEALMKFSEWMYYDSTIRAGINSGERLWVSNFENKMIGGFRYVDTDSYEEGTVVYPGLNLLISPVYGWIYLNTGDDKFKKIGDEIFNSGVRYENLDWSGKAFNQNYRLSFLYLQWRKEAKEKWIDSK